MDLIAMHIDSTATMKSFCNETFEDIDVAAIKITYVYDDHSISEQLIECSDVLFTEQFASFAIKQTL